MQSSYSKVKIFFGQLNPVQFFLLISSIFGLLFVFLTPPFQGPDEPAHFLRAYQISQFNFATDKEGEITGGRLPSSLGQAVKVTSEDPMIAGYPQHKYKIKKTWEATKPQDDTKTEVYNFSSTSLYGPIAYLPQAFGVGIGKIFNASPVFLMYLGRLANLGAWIFLIALSIRLIPRKKWLVAFIGLLPMALFQASTLSSDTTSLGLLSVFFCYILYLCQGKGILKRKTIYKLLALGVLIALTKQLIFLFLPLIFLLPQRLFSSRKSSIILKISLVAIPLFFVLAWAYINRGGPIDTGIYNGQNPSAQLKFILLNPHSYINTIWNTYFFTWGDGITRSVIGAFGWSDAPLSEAIVVFGYVALFSLYFLNTEKVKPWLSSKQKSLIILIALAYCIATTTALYVFFSPLQYKIVYGLQGRYFIPVLLLLVPILYGNLALTSKRTYRRIATISPVILLVASTITIFVRYYINNV